MPHLICCSNALDSALETILQNFIYQHTVDLENVQRNNEKGEFTRMTS
jgi:hypothetical protein